MVPAAMAVDGTSAAARARAWTRFGPRLIEEPIASRLRRRAIRTPARRIVMATRWGLRWSLDLDDNLQRRLFFAHSSEAATLFQVARRMRPDDVILDVGANVGTFLLPLLRHVAVRGKGIAVEPALDTATRLEENISRNGMADRVTIARVACGLRRRRDLFSASSTRHHDSGLRSLVGDGDPVGTVVVRRGEELVRELGLGHVDVVKIDVEGGEHAVLLGLDGLFRQAPPRLLVVELVEHRIPRATGSVRAVVAMLEGFGYRGWWIRYRGLQPLSQAPDRRGNALFLRDA